MGNDRERKFKCPSCQTEVPTEIPEASLINKPTFSMLLLVHQEAIICQGCGQAYTFVLQSINLRAQDILLAPVVIQKKDSDIIEVHTAIPPGALEELMKKKGN